MYLPNWLLESLAPFYDKRIKKLPIWWKKEIVCRKITKFQFILELILMFNVKNITITNYQWNCSPLLRRFHLTQYCKRVSCCRVTPSPRKSEALQRMRLMYLTFQTSMRFYLDLYSDITLNYNFNVLKIFMKRSAVYSTN